MKKTPLFIVFLIAVVFAVFRAVKIETDAGILDMIYWFTVIAATLFAAIRAFAGAVKLKDRGALFTGALGLGILAISAVYYCVYTFIAAGTEYSLNISDFSDACSYLFFLAVLAVLLLPAVKLKSVFRIGVNSVSAALILMTIYAIVVNNNSFLHITVIITAFICSSLSAYLLIRAQNAPQLKPARLFACSLIFLGVVDTAVYTLFLTNAGNGWYQTFAVFYIPAFIWLSEGLLNLRKGERSNG